jgi:predicted RNA-binding protein
MPDTADVRDAIDNGTLRDVIHGGVLATAFTRKTEATYDAAHWLKTGEHVRVGSITITKITAERAL